MTTLEGLVFKGRFAPESKSEHEGPMLRTEAGTYLLRRQSGNAFQDDVLEELIGQRIRGRGRVVDQVFLLESWEHL
jgi:hypothetical protein